MPSEAPGVQIDSTSTTPSPSLTPAWFKSAFFFHAPGLCSSHLAHCCLFITQKRERRGTAEKTERDPLLLGNNSWQELRAFSRSTRWCFFF